MSHPCRIWSDLDSCIVAMEERCTGRVLSATHQTVLSSTKPKPETLNQVTAMLQALKAHLLFISDLELSNLGPSAVYG